jgi:hypothetical protein
MFYIHDQSGTEPSSACSLLCIPGLNLLFYVTLILSLGLNHLLLNILLTVASFLDSSTHDGTEHSSLCFFLYLLYY